MIEALEPQEFELDGKTYILSKFPASAGRDIMVQFGISAMPKVGEYKTNRQMADRILSYVAVKTPEGSEIRLTTEALIDNHLNSWVSRIHLEGAMIAYNFDPLHDGRASSFFEDLALTSNKWITKTLTELSERLSAKKSQPSTSSEQSTL